jgi:hypothetical protein
MRELFIEELKQVRGGGKPPKPPNCGITTLACGEEAPPCDTCGPGPVPL